ncbi:MAG: beta-lactamase family protein [Proteobacteria bacterium]|nr:beta-lactamase family protein [Pseudomonadota bacterium]
MRAVSRGQGAVSDPGSGVATLLAPYRGRVPGISVAVCQQGRPVWEGSCGYADLEAVVAAGTDSNYRLASVSKQFTAAAVLLLLQDGRLTLEDSVRDWLPQLPRVAAPMTLRQLLLHRSGLVDYEELIPAGTTRPLRDADVLRLLQREDRSYFPPGTDWRYSDSGYALLALVVARCAGCDFASFLRTRIFQPLGMAGSVAHEEGVSNVTHRAFGYSSEGRSWRRTDQSLTSAVLGDGGVYSSVRDLVRWDAALRDSRLLSESSRALAFAPLTPTDDPQVHYGFGWRITGECLWHSGESLGFRTAILRFAQRGLTVIALSNRDRPEVYSLALAIAQLWWPGAAAMRATKVVVGPDSGSHPLPG